MMTSARLRVSALFAIGLLAASAGCGNTYYVETDYYPEVMCPPGSIWDGAWCVVQPGALVMECPAGTRWENGVCVQYVPQAHPHCPRGTWFNGTSCVWRQVGCPPGYRLDGRNCVKGAAPCPKGTFWNGLRCVKGNGPLVRCPAGSKFDGKRCLGPGGTGGGKPGGGTVGRNPPPDKPMLPATQCPPGQRWDPVAKKCITAKGRRPAQCAANQTWDGNKCVSRPVAPPRRPPATDKPADGRPGKPGERRPDTKACPAGQHMEGGKCVANPEKCPPGTHSVGRKCVPDANKPGNCPAGQRWNARSKTCVPAVKQRVPPKNPPKKKVCPPGERCK